LKTISKKSVLDACKIMVQVRMDNAQEAMNSAHESTLNEEKSSAGDKFETGRAMGHLNRDMFAKQRDQANKDMEILNGIQAFKRHSEVELGTLIYTKDKIFFIALGLGKIMVEVWVISEQSPLALAMLNKTLKDSFEFNAIKYKINNLE
jgi:hypothetical protein